MPLLTPPDVKEALKGTDAHRIYGELKEEWNGFGANYQALILMIRALFWQADLETNTNGMFGGACVFCGGHVELGDEASLYDLWKGALDSKKFGGGKRISSHSSEKDQYEIAMPKGWGTHLFGVRNGGTWFQNETYAITTTTSDYVGHVGTTIQYGASKAFAFLGVGTVQNIGAKGKSTLDDAHPLRLKTIPNLKDMVGDPGW
jgi:hypothetical protein